MAGKRITLKLSPEQVQQIKAATGKAAHQIELSVEELEARIAPVDISPITITKKTDSSSGALF